MRAATRDDPVVCPATDVLDQKDLNTWRKKPQLRAWSDQNQVVR